jgi:hypothetical protein
VFLEAYAWALKTGKAYWVERDTATGVIRDLLESVATRKRPRFLDSRTEESGGKRTLRVDNGKALAATKAQRARVRDFMRAFAATQNDPAFYRMIDVARRIAGTGSLGLERYVVLVRGRIARRQPPARSQGRTAFVVARHAEGAAAFVDIRGPSHRGDPAAHAGRPGRPARSGDDGRAPVRAARVATFR